MSAKQLGSSYEMKEKENPVTINTREIQANHKPKRALVLQPE